MIGEVTSISLDNNLEFIDSNTINGEFRIKGTYKMTEASTLEEKFDYEIPVDITLVENFDISSVKISIDNFYYEIINDDILKCNIDVLIDGIEEVIVEEDVESLEEVTPSEKPKEIILEDSEDRECDGDKKEDKKIEVEEIVEKEEDEKVAFKPEEPVEQLNKTMDNLKRDDEEMLDVSEEKNTNISSLFEAFSSTEETFKTYSVYIVRQNDSIDAIMDKYKVTKEELSDYNDLNNLEIGTKLIIPTTLDE